MNVGDAQFPPPETPFENAPISPAEPTVETPAEPPPLRVRAKPVNDSERFQSLDLVRGIAVFGVLLVNMGDFALVPGARYDPTISGGEGLWNWLVWLGIYLLADTKFIAIFTLLFGAGIALANQRRKLKRERRALAYHRRMLFLLLLGLAHGVFIWQGDILYYYAFWGLLLYFVPRIPTLIIFGVASILIVVNGIRSGASMLNMRPGFSWFHLDIYRGTWGEQVAWRFGDLPYSALELPIWYGLHLIGFLLLGMALLKSGFLSGERSTTRYAIIALVTIPLGVVLVGFGTQLETRFVSFLHTQAFYWGSVSLTFGYVAAAIAVSKIASNWLPVRALAAVGRMALTNYLSHSLICTTIFYGYGFGLYEHLDRVRMFAIIVAICSVQLVVSPLWLSFFRYGPFEWIWRSVTYWRWQPIRKAPSAVPEPMS